MIYIDGVRYEFNEAVKFCEIEFGYEGPAWDHVKQTGDLYQLEMFLNEDGIYADVDEDDDE